MRIVSLGLHQLSLSANKTNGTEYLPTLDGWRAIAILLVLVCHGTDAVFSGSGSYPNPMWYGLTRHGAFGVDIFFGISGFLICTSLLQEENKLGRIRLRRFYIRRAFRILPPYFAYLAAVGALALLGLIAINGWDWLSCFFFFRNYLPSATVGSWFTGHFWSLAIEEHFYLFFPTVLVLCGSRRARPLVLTLALAISAWRVLDVREQWFSRLLPGVGFYTRTDIRLDGLLWGCWMALLFAKRAWRDRLTRWLSPSVCVVLVVTLIACVYIQPPFAMLWQALLIPLLLISTVLRPASSVSRFLEASKMRWVGRISYSIYLWQQLFLVPGNERRPLGVLQCLPVNLIVVLAFATLSYYLLERPMIGVGRRLSLGHPAQKLGMASKTESQDELTSVFT